MIGKTWQRKDPDQNPAIGSLPFPDIAGGYIADDGTGSHPNLGPFRMHRTGEGVWETGLDDDFAALDHKPYMYKITRNDGSVAYRTDLYSRCQIGSGSFNPRGARYPGPRHGSRRYGELFGRRRSGHGDQYFREVPRCDELRSRGSGRNGNSFPNEEFWRDEFDATACPPAARRRPCHLRTAHRRLGFRQRRGRGRSTTRWRCSTIWWRSGVNAVELLPISEFGGTRTWGYGNSHHFAIESSAGGRDKYKFFVRACHQRGIAVIVDVVYNHYVPTPSARSGSTTPAATRTTSTTGTRATRLRLRVARRGLPRQHVDRLRAALPRRDGAQAVHQQRASLVRGLSRRRLSRRPDHVHPRLQRASTPTAGRPEPPTCSARSSCAS